MSKLKIFLILFLIKTICVEGWTAPEMIDPPDVGAEARPRARKKIVRKKKKKKRVYNRLKGRLEAEAETGAMASFPFYSGAREDVFDKYYFSFDSDFVFERLRPRATHHSYVLSLGARGWWDREKDHDLSLRALSASVLHSRYRLDLGLQEVGWGETFGLYILDLVNPRDSRDPLLDDLSWMRIPVAAANLRVFWGSTTLQLIATPVPARDKMPERGTQFDLLPDEASGIVVKELRTFSMDQFGQEAEYGGRFSHLFDNGFEAALMYYRHWNRNPVYALDASSALVPVQKRIQSYGFSMTQAFDSAVLRADAVWHSDSPVQDAQYDLAPYEDFQRAIVGLDWSFEEKWVLGGQFHIDLYEKTDRQWVSAKVEKTWAQSLLESELFVFGGLNNPDLWIQPKQTWYVSDQVSAVLSADILLNEEDDKNSHLSYLQGLRKRDRALLHLKAQF